MAFRAVIRSSPKPSSAVRTTARSISHPHARVASASPCSPCHSITTRHFTPQSGRMRCRPLTISDPMQPKPDIRKPPRPRHPMEHQVPLSKPAGVGTRDRGPIAAGAPPSGHLPPSGAHPVSSPVAGERLPPAVGPSVALSGIQHSPEFATESPSTIVWRFEFNWKLARLLREEYHLYRATPGSTNSGMILRGWATQLGLACTQAQKVCDAVAALRRRWSAVHLCRHDPEFADATWGTGIDAKYQCLDECCEVFDIIDPVMDRYHGTGWKSGSRELLASTIVRSNAGRAHHLRLCENLRVALVSPSPPRFAPDG